MEQVRLEAESAAGVLTTGRAEWYLSFAIAVSVRSSAAGGVRAAALVGVAIHLPRADARLRLGRNGSTRAGDLDVWVLSDAFDFAVCVGMRFGDVWGGFGFEEVQDASAAGWEL